MNRRLEFLIIIALTSIFFAWFAWPLVWTASENIRLVSVFNTAEADHLQMMKEAISTHSPKFDFGNYGHLFFNAALLPLFIMSYFFHPSEQQIILVMRLVVALFSIASIVTTFSLTRRYFGNLAAWLGAFLLFIVPLKFLDMSILAKPDVPQVFFIVLGMYFVCRFAEEKHHKWMVWASICAGLAFATKYSGIFLLPVIWVSLVSNITTSEKTQIQIDTGKFAVVVRYGIAIAGIACVIAGIVITPELIGHSLAADGRIDNISQIEFLKFVRITVLFIGCGLVISVIPKFIWKSIEQMPRLVAILKETFISLIAFGIAFLVTSPFSLYRLNFIRGLHFEARHTAFGHWFKTDSGGSTWLLMLASPELLDGFILSLVAIGLVLILYKGSQNGWRKLIFNSESLMWMFVICYLSYLILRVKIYWAHYLLPVIPFLIVLSTQPVSQAMGYVRRRLSGRQVIVFAIAIFIILIIAGVELPKSFARLHQYRQSILSREENTTSVKVGTWLTECYPSSTRILYDYYSYIPPSFFNAHGTWGGTIKALKILDPDIVVVNRVIAERYSDIHKATRYDAGESEFKQKHEYYEALNQGRTNYTLIHDFSNIQVYAKSSD